MTQQMKFGIGAPMRRKEDPAFLTGRGRYLADTVPGDAAHAVMVRSQHAHADFTLANLDEVRAMPGVLAVLTARDVEHLNAMPSINVPMNHDGSPVTVPQFPILRARACAMSATPWPPWSRTRRSRRARRPRR